MARPKFSYKEYSEQLENTLLGVRAKNRALRAQVKLLEQRLAKVEDFCEAIDTHIDGPAFEAVPEAKPLPLKGTVYRVHCVARERGSFPEEWHRDFATMKEAKAYMKSFNDKNTSPTAPDYYEQADRIETIEISVNEQDRG
jgi:hypothetical protein